MVTKNKTSTTRRQNDPCVRVIHAMTRQVEPGLSEIVGRFAGDGDKEALAVLAELGLHGAPKNYDTAKKVFMPVLRNFALTQNNAVGLLRQWTAAFGFTKEEHFSPLLAKIDLMASTTLIHDVTSLIALGANPNANCSSTDLEPLTILGRAIADSSNHRMPELIRCMLTNVIARGEVPYYRRNYAGKPQTIFDALVDISPPATVMAGVMETIDSLSQRGGFPDTVAEAIGSAFLRERAPASEPTKSQEEWQRRRLRMLSYARFPTDQGWHRALYNPNDERGLARLLVLTSSEEQSVRLVHAMTRDQVALDDIPCEIRVENAMIPDGTELRNIPAEKLERAIPCTLLQGAAFYGKQQIVVALLEGGADANRKVAIEYDGFPSAEMDAEELWKLNSGGAPSQALSAWKARAAIGSLIRKVRAGG